MQLSQHSKTIFVQGHFEDQLVFTKACLNRMRKLYNVCKKDCDMIGEEPVSSNPLHIFACSHHDLNHI